VKSDEIPEKNDEPVKVIVRKSFNKLVLDSGKNGVFKNFQPILLDSSARDTVKFFASSLPSA